MLARIQEKLDHTNIVDDNVKWYSSLENSAEVLVQLKMGDPATTLIGIYPKKIKNIFTQKLVHVWFIAALSVIV